MYQPATNITASYNGYTFSPLMETLDARITPVEGSDKRTVLYNIFRLTLKDQISISQFSTSQLASAGGGTIDNTFQTIRQQLSSQGGAFVYQNAGLGNLSINVGSVRDVVWGPRCKELAWKPHGPGNAAEFTWQIEIAIPDCPNASFAFAFLEFVYKLQFSIDRSGYTRRIYSGFLRVPMTRKSQGDRTLPDTADAYREKISPAMVPGFRRIPGEFTLDESKTRLDFSITDEQLGPQALPAGVIDCKARFNVASVQKGLKFYVATLTASYEMARTANRSDAWTSFAALALDRIGWCAQNCAQKGSVIPIHFSFGEPDIFGRESAEFAVSWSFIDSLQTVLGVSGAWRAVPNTDFSKWQQSLSNVLGPRGFSGLKHLPKDDLIIDLCKPQSQGLAPVLRTGPLPNMQRFLRSAGIPQVPPSPGASWMAYDLRTEVNVRDGYVFQTALPNISQLKTGQPGSTSTLSTGGTGGFSDGGGGDFGDLGAVPGETAPLLVFTPGGGGSFAPDGQSAARGGDQPTWGALPGGGSGWLPGSAGNPNSSSENGSVAFLPLSPVNNFGGTGGSKVGYRKVKVPGTAVQARAAPQIYITLIGYAIRAGYLIDLPQVIRVGNAIAVPANGRYHGFRQSIIGFSTVPIVLAEWNLRYRLLTPPEQAVLPPENPIFN